MEGVTNEIRNKIKCAVKAKLQEIGAYVDEELPDYIMVMIANRRSKSQMTSELSLFLGSHTDKFTDWLHVVLEKLEAFVSSGSTVDKTKESSSIVPTPESEPFSLSMDVHDFAVQAVHQPSALHNEKPLNPPTGLHAENMTRSHTNEMNLNILTNISSQNPYVPAPLFGNSIASKVQQPVEDMEEDCLNIREEIEQDFHADDKVQKKHQTLPSSHYKSSYPDHKRRRHTRSADSRDAKKIRHEDKNRPRRSDGHRISSQVVSVVRPMLSQVTKPGDRNRMRVESNDHDESSTSNKNGVNSIVRVTARRKLPAKMQATNSLILKAVAEAQKSVISCPPKAMEPEPKPLPALFTRKYREKNLNVQTMAVTISNSHISPLIKPTMEIDAQRNVELETNQQDIQSLDIVHTEKEVPDESSNEPMETPDSPIHSQTINQKIETRFIVTLDGAHPQMSQCYDEELNDDDETEMTDLNDSERKPVKSRLFRRRSTGTEAEVQQSLERCKFWPNCRQGVRCSFHHPKTPCKNFPNCLFGESCLFIHPKCKFDTTCTRKSCPFTHSSLQSKPVISIVPMTVPVKLHPQSLPVVNGKTVCKYFPACNNVSCSFFHPTACKYGSNCTRVGCTFSHPSAIPSINKLKWVPSTK